MKQIAALLRGRLHASVPQVFAHARLCSLHNALHLHHLNGCNTLPPAQHPQRSMCTESQPTLLPDSQDVLRERLLQAAMKHVVRCLL